MEEIKRIVKRCLKKLKYKINNDEIEKTYYNIFLTSVGINNGFFLNLFDYYVFINKNNFSNNQQFINYISDVFKELKTIKNIDFYIGKLKDNSYYKDTIYIYYKPKEKELFKIIKFIEKNKINDKYNKIIKNILKLLSYEPIIFNNFNNICEVIFKINNLNIFSYYINKKKLYKAYDKLLEIKKP
jgi:hypothetical protein